MRRDSTNSIRKRCGSRRNERKRDWSRYNEWQCKEIVLACTVLRGIVDSTKVHDWDRRNGRPGIARRDIVLCLLVKAYLNVSYRRLTGFLRVLRPYLGLSSIPHFNTLAAYNRMPSMEGTLKSLLEHTAEGAWKEESTIAIDSSGLLLHGSGSWRSSRYREGRKDYGKIHVLSGTDSLMTLAVRTTRGTWHDSTQLDQLMNEVPEYSAATAVAADSAYWNHRCCNAARAAGLQPYFRPKCNAVLPRHISDAFDSMTYYSMKFVNRFRSRYHRRSMAETRYYMEKVIFGERLRCRKPVSRRNEVLAREICHNARLLAKGARS